MQQNLLTKLFAAAVIVLLAVGALSQLIGSLENFFSDEQDRDSAWTRPARASYRNMDGRSIDT